MLQLSTLKYLKDLKKNNNKVWFDKNRSIYEEAKADFISLIDEMIPEIAKFDPTVGELSGKSCIFRINRDIRFSKDKTPYKSHMAASFKKDGKKMSDAGYYFHVEPGQSFIGGGCYMPLPEDLNKIRQEIDYNFDEWKKIINSKNFKKYFPKGIEGTETLVRPPKGYDETNPAIEFLKMKGFFVTSDISDAVLTDKKSIKELIKILEAIKPLTDFLNKAKE